MSALVAAIPTATAQDAGRHQRTLDVRAAVQAIAFDPATFFPDEDVGDRSIIRIAYTGDDWGWPVYAIAVAQGCVAGEARTQSCRTRLRARMVRAPAPPDMSRPRQRGSYLVGRLVERGALTRAAIQAALRDVGVEWLEADVAQCAGARAALARSATLDWVPPAVSDPFSQAELSLVLHADIVEVAFDQYARQSTYRGYRAEGSPAAWAASFAETLEPCWRAASAAPPWQRGPAPAQGAR